MLVADLPRIATGLAAGAVRERQGGNGTAVTSAAPGASFRLAFLNTVRTERFDEVLALRTVLSTLAPMQAGERSALPIAP